MKILSIDPGAKTGAAFFENGQLKNLFTTDPLAVLAMINLNYDCIIFEDSTLQSHIFTAPSVKGAAKLKIARNIGQVDGYCKLIVQACANASKPCLQISPKNKGAKLNAKQFADITGWDKPSNQHERDAAMVGWQYRSMK
jgi:hypothetical protein